MTDPRDLLRADLVVRGGLGFFLGDTRIRLLEAVAQHGSITQAAKAVPMSYKAAWDAIDEMNNLAPQPLVSRSVGGRRGGGAHLTAYGGNMVALYRALQAKSGAAVRSLALALGEAEGADTDELRRLLARLAVRTSARNQFIGTIEALRGTPEDVDVEVILRIDADFVLRAVVTADAVERLDLHQGLDVAAVVSAAAVHLGTGQPSLRTTARNHFHGRVLEVHRGPVNAEVTLALSRGRTLTATITRAAADDLGLVPGTQAEAIFKASSLILQRIDG